MSPRNIFSQLDPCGHLYLCCLSGRCNGLLRASHSGNGTFRSFCEVSEIFTSHYTDRSVLYRAVAIGVGAGGVGVGIVAFPRFFVGFPPVVFIGTPVVIFTPPPTVVVQVGPVVVVATR